MGSGAGHARPILKSGVHFKEGKVYVFSKKIQRVLVVRPWNPWPAAWELDLTVPGAVFRGVCPDIRVRAWHVGFAPAPGNQWDRPLRVSQRGSIDSPPRYLWASDLRRLSALKSFFEQIPREVRLAVGGVSQQYRMLATARAVGGPFLELCGAALPLAYAVAGFRALTKVKRPLRSARLLFRPGIRRRDMVERMGFQGGNTALQLMLKIPTWDLSLGTLVDLRRVMALTDEAAVKLRAHLPTVTRAALELLRPDTLPHVTPRLLAEVASSDDSYPETAFQLRDTLMMAQGGGLRNIGRLVFHSVSALRYCHDDLVRRMGRRTEEPMEAITIPPPPLPGGRIEGVEFRPLSTVEEICNRGAEMRQCLGIEYARRVARSQSGNSPLYIYAMRSVEGRTAGEEATLLVRGMPDALSILELKGWGNRPSSLWPAARQFVASPATARIGSETGAAL